MQPIEITRNRPLNAGIAVVALALALAFLLRAGGPFDIIVGLILLAIGLGQAWSTYDARLPLLIADPQGIRLRAGSEWKGLPWSDIEEVEHLPRSGWFTDGKLVLLPRGEADLVTSLSPAGRRQAKVTERIYGAPFVLPLGLNTRIKGVNGSLSAQLADLSEGATSIVEVDSGAAAAVAPVEAALQPALVPVASEPVLAPEPVLADALLADFSDETAAASRVEISSVAGVAPEAVMNDGRTDTAEVPVVRDVIIGSVLVAARENLGLSLDELAERSRIRPRIIAAIESEDFAPCGGDFYARGHLRTLARVLGIDGAPLVEKFDDLYADAPAEIAPILAPEMTPLTGSTGGALRPTRTGPNWSVLVATVMSVVLVWSIARMVFDGASPEPAPAIGLSAGSAGTTNPYGKAAKAVPVELTAVGGGAEVVVRDGAGTVVFSGQLSFGQSKTVKVSPPVRVQSSDGSLTVKVGSAEAKAVGKTGVAGQRIYAGTHE